MKPISEKPKTNILKIINQVCKTASCVILLFMVVLLVLRHTPAEAYLPVWLADGSFIRKYLIPVCASAAVGYLTNAIAIWMLFKPYEKHWFWPQGVIPRQKKNFGRQLGILIPQHLLQPEKISARIGQTALQYLKDPVFIGKIRAYVQSFLVQHRDIIARTLVPYIQDWTVQAVRDTMTRENFNRLCQAMTKKFLTEPAVREKTVRTAVDLFKELLPGFSADLKRVFAEKAAESFRKEHPVVSWFKDHLSGNSVQDEVEKFWSEGEAELLNDLEQQETREKIARYVAKALVQAREWTERPENTAQIELFLQGKQESVKQSVSAYLEGKIPVLADQLLSSDSFWIMLQEKALPAIQLYVVKLLRGDSNSLLARIDIPGKIENAVDKMDMEQLHHFVIQASNDNLTLLQIFGFFLGAAAGIIMSLVI